MRWWWLCVAFLCMVQQSAATNWRFDGKIGRWVLNDVRQRMPQSHGGFTHLVTDAGQDSVSYRSHTGRQTAPLPQHPVENSEDLQSRASRARTQYISGQNYVQPHSRRHSYARPQSNMYDYDNRFNYTTQQSMAGVVQSQPGKYNSSYDQRQNNTSQNQSMASDDNAKMKKSEEMKCAKKSRSGRCLTRQKRELVLPRGFAFAVEPKLQFIIYENDDFGAVRLQVKSDFQYTPPARMVDSDGRSATTLHKQLLYRTIKATFSRFGLDGEACLQRAICEIAETPLRSDGLFGEILNIILSPSHRLSRAEDTGDLAQLLEAERRGRALGECHLAYPACPISLFNVADAVADYTGSILDTLADHPLDDLD